MKLPPGHVPGLGVHKATAYGGFGQQMLEKMGWNKGQGLGKEKHGMKEAIEVKKKEDTLGVGAASSGWKWDWKYWEDAYNTGLSSMKSGSKKNGSKKKRRRKSSSRNSSDSSGSDASSSGDSGSDSDSDSDSSESDDEHNARIAAALNRDGTTASASAAELKLAKQLAKDPWGRFGGREGKMARIRQQEAEQAAAMQAKLGIQQATAAAAGAAAAAATCKASSSSEDTAAAAAGSKTGKKRKHAEAVVSSRDDGASTAGAAAASKAGSKKSKLDKKRAKSKETSQQQQQQSQAEGQPAQQGAAAPSVPSKPRMVVVVDVKGPSNVQAFQSFTPTPASGWWGAKMFASAGLLEGIEQDTEQRQRTTFDEDMQAKVYMAAHDAQRQGKRGLGKSTKLKIAGGNWEGKKVTYDEEGGSGDQEQQQQQQDRRDDPATAGSGSGSEGAAAGSTKDKKTAKPSGKQGKVKWAKLAVSQLQEVPGGVLKWKKLWPELLKQAELQGTAAAGDKEKCWKKLQACTQLQVTGKLVSLAA